MPYAIYLFLYSFDIMPFYSARKGAEFRIRDGFFFVFFSCRDLVIFDFLCNLRRAIKLVLNSPTYLCIVVSVVLLRMR